MLVCVLRGISWVDGDGDTDGMGMCVFVCVRVMELLSNGFA